MELIKLKFDKIKESNNPDIINDFIFKLSENPEKEHLVFLKYFIANLDTQIFDKIKLSLVFLFGEIGKISTLDAKCLQFLVDTYFKSDRWIRNEIIQAFGKILKKTEISQDAIKLIGNAINDEYPPIKVNALRILLNFDDIPLFVRRNLFFTLNLKDLELEELCVKILEKFLPDFNQLFNSLNYLDNYLILKPKAIRTLLLIYFKSPINLESFRKKISSSNWEIEHRERYLKEIDTYEKILLKKI